MEGQDKIKRTIVNKATTVRILQDAERTITTNLAIKGTYNTNDMME